MKLAFHGAALTVTGSRFLLEANGRRILIDAGMFQGLKALRLLNWSQPPFEPSRIDHLLLTHAHIDHSGAIPRLVKLGLRAPIHATPATIDLARLMLLDSASLQEDDARYANKKGFSKHSPALPLYTVEDAERALLQFRPAAYGQWLELGPGIGARFSNAGHMLGSGFVELRVAEDGRERTLLFSGDVGRYDMPLHADPEPMPACDVLVVESTYGDRDHEKAPLGAQMAAVLGPALARGGTVLIPAFAVGRSQLVTLVLRDLMERGALPEVPIHIDSPMATDATTIYNRYLSGDELDRGLEAGKGKGMFPRNVTFHRSTAQSRALNELPGPRILLSSSGMMTGGRVLHHLARLAGDPRNLIALVGFQAEGTRGRRLLQGQGRVRVHGADLEVRAQVASLNGFSGHADRGELLRWIGTAPRPPASVFVVHGEPAAARALARDLEGRAGIRATVPELGAAFTL